MPENHTVNTEGGTYVGENVNSGKDFVGRDKNQTNVDTQLIIIPGDFYNPQLTNLSDKSRSHAKILSILSDVSLIIVWLVFVIALPAIAVLVFVDNVIQNYWLALGLLLAYEFFLLSISIVIKVWQRLEGRWVEWLSERVYRFVRELSIGYRRRYLRHLFFRHRNFDVKGLTTQGSYTLELQRVFVELAIAPRPLHATSADPVRPPPKELSGQHPIWYFLTAKGMRSHNFAIIGAPGSGKTTLLKNIALILTANYFRRRRIGAPKKLPILLFLRDHAVDINSNWTFTLPQAIERQIQRESGPRPSSTWFTKQLQAKRCLIMFDGLDEVADAVIREKVARWVEDQILAFSGNRFIVSSRPHGYRTNPLNDVTVLEIQPLTYSQVREFIHNWYYANEIMSSQKDDHGVTMAAREGAEDLLRRLHKSPTLTELGVNPLLLTMIATVHRYRSMLPSHRVQLYSEVCEVFLGKRQQAKGVEVLLSPAQKQRVLQPLAYHMMCTGQIKIKINDAVNVIVAPLTLVIGTTHSESCKEFLRTVESSSGIFLEREVGEYSFAHKAFQEYLASVHICEQQLVSELITHVRDPWWHETCRLYCAQFDASPVVTACLEQKPLSVENLVLAIECVEEAREVLPSLREYLERVLSEEVEDTDTDRRNRLANVLLELRLRRMLPVDNGRFVDTSYLTHIEYQLFLNDVQTQRRFFQPDHWLHISFPKGAGKLPVAGIRPTDAVAFCKWLNEQKSRDWHYRLPEPGELTKYGNDLFAKSSGDMVGYWVQQVNRISFEREQTKNYKLSTALIKTYVENDRQWRQKNQADADKIAHRLGIDLTCIDKLESSFEDSKVIAVKQALQNDPTAENARKLAEILPTVSSLASSLRDSLNLDRFGNESFSLSLEAMNDNLAYYDIRYIDFSEISSKLQQALNFAQKLRSDFKEGIAEAISTTSRVARNLELVKSGKIPLTNDIGYNMFMAVPEQLAIITEAADEFLSKIRLEKELTLNVSPDSSYATDFHNNIASYLDYIHHIRLDEASQLEFIKSANLIYYIKIALNYVLIRNLSHLSNQPGISANSRDFKFLRWFIRVSALLVIDAAQIVKVEQQPTYSGSAATSKKERELQGIIDNFLQLYINFAVLEARIEGRTPAVEGIIIIKERATTTHNKL